MTTRNRFWLCTAATLALGAATEARAQAPEGATTISEVIVTAQRRSEVLENVPMAVTTLSPQVLARSNITNFMELGRVTTGLQMNFAGSVPGVALHGISTQISGYSVEPNVATYIDGFYQPQMLTIQGDMSNLASVEVLKGPQGTLWGRNATGGAILINTLGPTKELTGKASVSYGRFDEWIGDGYLAGPISDRVRFSIAAHGRRSDGWIRLASPTTIGETNGPAAPIRVANVRGKLEADVTDELTALLAMNYTYSRDAQANPIDYVGHINSALLAPPPARSNTWGVVAYNHGARQYGVNYNPTLTLNYKTPIGVLKSYTGWAHQIAFNEFDFDGTYVDTTFSHVKYDEETFQQTIDYSINAIKNLDLVVGGMYYRDYIKTQPAILVFGPNLGLAQLIYTTQISKAFSFYIDGNYHITDKLTLDLGGRYTHDKRAATAIATTARGVVLFNKTGVNGGDASWNRFTPRVTLRYEIAPRTSVYGSWQKGFRSGVFNSTGPALPSLPFTPARPEDISAFELGFKTANSTVRFQSSAFYYDYKNLQVTVVAPNPLLPPSSGAIISVLQNAPGAKIYGWDNEATWNPVQRLEIRAGVSLLHARFKSFTNWTGTGVNASNTLNVTNQVQDLTGLRLPRAPDVTGNIGVNYTAPIQYGTLDFNVSANYTSSFAVSNPSVYGPLAPAPLQRKQRFVQSAYTLVNGSVTWTAPTDKYYVTLFGSNLTNKDYRMSYNGSIFGDYSAKAAPRTYGVRVGASF